MSDYLRTYHKNANTLYVAVYRHVHAWYFYQNF